MLDTKSLKRKWPWSLLTYLGRQRESEAVVKVGFLGRGQVMNGMKILPFSPKACVGVCHAQGPLILKLRGKV